MTTFQLGFISLTLYPVLLSISVVIGLIVSLIIAIKHSGKLLKSLYAGFFTIVGTYAAFSFLIAVASSHAIVPNNDFVMLNGQSIKINEISLQRPIVMNLWATSCEPCLREIPLLEQAEQRYDNIAFISLNQRDNNERVQQFVTQNELNLKHILLDTKGIVAENKGIFSYPVTLFFDTNGQLVYSHDGELSEKELEYGINNYL